MDPKENEANLIHVDSWSSDQSDDVKGLVPERVPTPTTALARFFDDSAQEFANEVDAARIHITIAEYVCSNLESDGALLWMPVEGQLQIVFEIDLEADQIEPETAVVSKLTGLSVESFDELRCALVNAEDFNAEDINATEITEADSDLNHNSDPTHSFEETGFTELDSLAAKCKQIYIPFIKQGICEAVLTAFVPADSTWSMMDLIVITQRIELILLQHSSQFHTQRIESKNTLLSRLKTLQENVSRNLDETKNAYDIVNEIHAFLGKGRVTFLSFRGTTCKVKAVSGQATFNRRSPILVNIESLSAMAAKSAGEIFYPEDEDRFPQKIRNRFEKYFEAADSRSIALFPLTKKEEPSENPNDIAAVLRDRDAKPGKVVGVIVIEGLGESFDREELVPLWEPCAPMVANSVANARQHAGLFMMPVWRKLGMFADLYRGHRRNIAILVSVILVVAFLALALIQTDFQLRCKGVIQPAQRSQIFAEVEGTVAELLVDDGTSVKKGDLLLKLTNPQLEADYAAVEGDLHESEAALKTILHQRLYENQDQSEGSDRLSQDRASLMQENARRESKVKSLKRQLNLLAEQKSRLRIVSPDDGIVITWNLKNRLTNRPVKNGDLLMVIAKPDSPWELDLRVPDKRAGYMLEAWNKRTKNQSQKVTYCIASQPSKNHFGEVREIAPSTNLDDKDGNVLRVYVDLNKHPKQEGMRVRPGTEVIAHVHAGRCSIGYTKFYEFIDWTRRVWFQYAG